MAESGTLIDDFSKYTAFKVEGNKYVVYGIFAIVILFIVYFVIVYSPLKAFEKGKTIRWVVTGDVLSSDESGAVYSYDGIDYITTQGQYLNSPRAAAYGRSVDNNEFFWIVGGFARTITVPSMVNSYNGYLWKQNESQLAITWGLEYGLSGNNQPLWLATGVTENFDDGKIIYSSNGLCWKESNGLKFTIGYALSYGKTSTPSKDHMYVAGGNGSTDGNSNMLYSYEGLSWVMSEGACFGSFDVNGNITPYRCTGVAYGLCGTTPIWVATGVQKGSKRSILYSVNGISWNETSGEDFTRDPVTDNKSAFGVAFGLNNLGNHIWVAVGDGLSNSILFSMDGKNWSKSSGSCFNGHGSGVAYGETENGDPLWVAVGNDLSGNNKNEILVSFNGTSWISSEDPVFGSSFAYGVASNILKYGVKPF